MDRLTVKIVSDKHPQGWVLLNQDDYDANPGAYELYVEKVVQLATGTSEGSNPPTGTLEGSPANSGANEGSKLALPVDLDSWKKADLQNWALENLDLDVDPDKMTQPQMVTAIRNDFAEKFPG